MHKIKTFIKDEIVLVIASLLALFSCIFVPVSKSYINYIDFRVLSLLFCLMAIVAGLRSVNFFYKLSAFLFKNAGSIRKVSLIFIMLCFFFSMLITNDVALILFIPFSIFVLKKHLNEKLFIILIVLETIAANLGSMLTPIGNPQNLYLFSAYNMELSHFLLTTLPYSVCSLLMLILCSTIFPPENFSSEIVANSEEQEDINYKLHYICYTSLFLLTLLTVIRIIPYQLTLIVCIIIIAVINRKLFLSVDYCLLLTFIAFFVFVGNLGEIETIKNFITGITNGHEIISSVLASQFISNVPAALLLSGFTDNGTALLVGTNIGGLGTIIASMASLISYKFYAKEKGSSIPAYFLWFTIFNIVFLIILLSISYIPALRL